MARFRIRPRASWASWQGPVGAACVVGAVGWLAAPAWALLTLGVFLLVGAWAER